MSCHYPTPTTSLIEFIFLSHGNQNHHLNRFSAVVFVAAQLQLVSRLRFTNGFCDGMTGGGIRLPPITVRKGGPAPKLGDTEDCIALVGTGPLFQQKHGDETNTSQPGNDSQLFGNNSVNTEPSPRISTTQLDTSTVFRNELALDKDTEISPSPERETDPPNDAGQSKINGDKQDTEPEVKSSKNKRKSKVSTWPPPDGNEPGEDPHERGIDCPETLTKKREETSVETSSRRGSFFRKSSVQEGGRKFKLAATRVLLDRM